jgi:hypothetical protein
MSIGLSGAPPSPPPGSRAHTSAGVGGASSGEPVLEDQATCAVCG